MVRERSPGFSFCCRVRVPVLDDRHGVAGDRPTRAKVLHGFLGSLTGCTEVAEENAVLVSLDELRELCADPDQLGGAAVHDEDAVLHSVSVRTEEVRDPDPPPVIGHVVCDQVTPGMVGHRILTDR